MTDHFDSIRLEKPRALRAQIRSAVRDLILSGKLRAGDQIPSTQALARKWGTDVCTVHAALSPLQKEGLLLRSPRKGTFVRQREEKLTGVAVYGDASVLQPNYSFYMQALHAAVGRRLEQLGIRMAVCTDARPKPQKSEPLPELVELAERRQVQAVIAPAADPRRLRWLERLPVPFAVCTSAAAPGRVTTDPRQMLALALRAVAKQGGRTVGLIVPQDVTEGDLSWPTAFLEVTQQFGLAIKNDWVRLARTSVTRIGGLPQPWDEQFGYEQFHALWRQRERPEALVVFPDTAVRGVVTAVLEAGVRVPAELKLVLHKNAEVPLLCPLPATFVVLSLTEIAHALVDSVQKQFAGRPVGTVMVPARLEPVTTDARGKPRRIAVPKV